MKLTKDKTDLYRLTAHDFFNPNDLDKTFVHVACGTIEDCEKVFMKWLYEHLDNNFVFAEEEEEASAQITHAKNFFNKVKNEGYKPNREEIMHEFIIEHLITVEK